MNQPIPRPRHRPYRPTWTATPGTVVTVGVELDPDERDGPTMAEIDEAAEHGAIVKPAGQVWTAGGVAWTEWQEDAE